MERDEVICLKWHSYKVAEPVLLIATLFRGKKSQLLISLLMSWKLILFKTPYFFVTSIFLPKSLVSLLAVVYTFLFLFLGKHFISFLLVTCNVNFPFLIRESNWKNLPFQSQDVLSPLLELSRDIWISKEKWTYFTFKFSKATLTASSASYEIDEFGYLKEVSTKINPFPRICFSYYYIDSFLHIVGLAKSYRTARKLISWYFCVKKGRKIQAVRCQKKSTPYKLLAKFINLVLLNKPSIFSFICGSFLYHSLHFSE